MSAISSAYENWSKEDLIARLRQLDQLQTHRRPPHEHPIKRHTEPFDFAAHPKRKIALKFCYHGQHFSGMEFQMTPTQLPTVEGVLFSALAYARLVDPHGGLEGCGWERCGRTDRGVSAAQQVVSLWVRSAIGDKELPSEDKAQLEEVSSSSSLEPSKNEDGLGLVGDLDFVGDWDEPPTNSGRRTPPKEPSELRYVALLNNILPPTIRIIAWSPVSPNFSARFNCQHRHYKYFFTSDGLDIEAMQDAASRLVGEHDFRNMCKMDPRKQLTHFVRKVKRATISPISNGLAPTTNMYVFDLIGSAFLYNQVRHIMALLFLVGAHLEQPSIINALMNTDPNSPLSPFRPDESAPSLVLTKPDYQMADPLPLVLWDSAYEDSLLNWQVEPDEQLSESSTSESKPGLSSRDLSAKLYDIMHSLYTRSLIQTTLDAHFLSVVSQYHTPSPRYLPLGAPGTQPIPSGGTFGYPLGGASYKRGSKYVPVLERPRMASAEEVNERWRLGRGRKQWERRLEKRAAYEARSGTSTPGDEATPSPSADVDE
ncbi:unnamed protein product [Somion occarium]